MPLGALAAVCVVGILAVALVERNGSYIKSLVAAYFMAWLAAVGGPPAARAVGEVLGVFA